MAVQAYQKNGWRETQEVAYFRNNSISTPAGIFTIVPVGGRSQPTIDTQALEDTQMGKATGRGGLKSAYNPGSYNS